MTRRLAAKLVAGAVLLITLVAAVGWWVVVPHWRPGLRDGERYGIDVSNHQGRIDWERVADDDIDAAYVKATEGGDFVDDRFAENWEGAGAAGLERGAYHFFTLCRSGADQAANFLRVAPPDTAALPPAVDLELGGNCSARPAEEALLEELRAFLEVVERAWGRPALLYTNDDFDDHYAVRELGRPLWEIGRVFRPSDHRWQVWQLHGFAKVDGVPGRVDLDVLRLPRPPG